MPPSASILMTYWSNLLVSIGHENVFVLIGDCCIVFAFLVEGIAIIKSKNISRMSLFSYLLFTMGSLMWFGYGISSKDYWISTANCVAVMIQFSVLLVIFYILKISHTKTFIKLKNKTSKYKV